MVFHVLEGNSELRIWNKNFAQKLPQRLADKLVVLRLARAHLLIDSLGGLCLEWSLSGYDFKHEDAE